MWTGKWVMRHQKAQLLTSKHGRLNVASSHKVSGEQLSSQAPGIVVWHVCPGRGLSKYRAVFSARLAETVSIKYYKADPPCYLPLHFLNPFNSVIFYSYLAKKIHYQHPFWQEILNLSWKKKELNGYSFKSTQASYTFLSSSCRRVF